MEIDANDIKKVGSDVGAFRWGTTARGMEKIEVEERQKLLKKKT